MSVYYVQHLYIYIMFKKCQKMSKLYPLGTKTKTKKFVRMKTSHFIF